MGFAEWTASRRRSANLKNELKELKVNILNINGGDKAKLTNVFTEFAAVLETAETLCADYGMAREQLMLAQEMLEQLLEQMGLEPTAAIKADLKELMVHMEALYHDCSIREDDMDYQSTIQNLKQMAEQYSEHMTSMQMIMLRSELENVKSIMDDVAGWSAPDFMALAYYYRHADKNTFRDMENEQRNQLIEAYFKENFMNALEEQVKYAGKETELRALIHRYMNQSHIGLL